MQNEMYATFIMYYDINFSKVSAIVDLNSNFSTGKLTSENFHQSFGGALKV
jgi:hypothetical protein